MNHLSLFSGIGGADLASEWAGFTTVGQVEWADYPTKVLEKHWPNVPRWRDICEFGIETFRARTGLQTVDVISGGFPCQPFSTQGQRKGNNDNRFLWPEMLRIIEELKPTWVIGENVTGIISLALDQVLAELEDKDYSTETFIIPASGVNAFHKRERVFIVANSNKELRKTNKIHATTNTKSTRQAHKEWSDFFVLNSGNNNIEFRETDTSRICRDDDGIPRELDKFRLGCLGNAIVPQQIYPIFQAIADIEANT